MTKWRATVLLILPVFVISLCSFAPAQLSTVQAQLKVKHLGNSSKTDSSNVVVWLMPLDGNVPVQPAKPGQYKITQRNKEFHPHVLAVPLGTPVEFPNDDPFFHNVFSLYRGKKFDLGLYEAGSSRTVVFDKRGVSFIFCNIHPDMNSYVLALGTPYFQTTGADGRVQLQNVANGRYRLEVWYERAEGDELAKLSRVVDVKGPNVNLNTIEVRDSPNFQPKHLNKHGRPYDPEAPPY